MSLVFAVLPPAIVATATVSGIFGMGGGMILMGVLASLLPVASAMVLHGVTQLASNGYRAWLLRRHVFLPALGLFAAGAVVSAAVMTALAITVDRATLFLFLGGLPLVVAALPRTWAPSIESRPVALATGVLLTAGQIVAGAAGPLLDIVFVRSRLTRHQVVATKALLSGGAHLVKLVYFLFLIPGGDIALPVWIYPLAIALAFTGTAIGKRILDRLSDHRFRALSTRLVTAIAIVFLVRGALG